MSKELPYFKFYPAEYLTGDITLCSEAEQGIFLNICCYYWMKQGNIQIENIRARFNNNMRAIEKLLDRDILKVDESDNIIIEFLDEQLSEFEDIRVKNSLAGKESARVRAERAFNTRSTDKNCALNHIEKRREEKRREDKDIYMQFFENFRKKYPGTKRGLKTEYDNFRKKYKDWKEIAGTLENELQRQVKEREDLKFKPEWPNLATYINQRRWETEYHGEKEDPGGNSSCKKYTYREMLSLIHEGKAQNTDDFRKIEKPDSPPFWMKVTDYETYKQTNERNTDHNTGN